MDRVTKGLVKDFLNNFELKDIKDSKNFEKFVNYAIIKNEFNNDFNIDDISTGENQGIDGIGIIVNNQFISNIIEIKDIIEETRFLDVQFIFIQSKTSDKFEGSEIGNLFFTVKDFFSEKPQIPMTEEVKIKFDIKEIIFNYFHLMTKGNPTCKLYFVSLGKWSDDQSLNAIISRNKEELTDLGVFESVAFKPYDARGIQKQYLKTSEESSAEFSFSNSPVNLPDIVNVDEAYLGLVQFEQYKKLIMDENGNIKNVFYDNVRDYLGENIVNKKIHDTLIGKDFEIFPLLNNGITIVADSKKGSKGNTQFSIQNYQIVNGCQTSHTLFINRNIDGIENVHIPIKLIFTRNEDVKNKITIATNSQTAITEEQLLAFSDFQKTLEQFYKSYEGEEKLFYERRSGQYSSEQTIIKSRIITIKSQIKAFSSLFLDLPHLASGYYGKLFNAVKDTITNNDHELIVYYTSSYILYKFEKLIRSGIIERKYNKIRFHILMLYKLIIADQNKIPNLNSKKINEFCNKLITSFNNTSEFNGCLKKIEQIIDKSRLDINNQKLLYQKSNTDLLINTFRGIKWH